MRELYDVQLTNLQEIITFGDFNDYSDKVSDSANDVPISRVVRILRDGTIKSPIANDTANSTANNEEVDISFYEPSQNVVQAQRYTSAYEVTKVSMIDHILMTQRVANAIMGVTFDHSYPRETVSDHWPVFIDIKTPFY